MEAMVGLLSLELFLAQRRRQALPDLYAVLQDILNSNNVVSARHPL